ncbi:hypothetical protein [Halomicrococcus gelatinilyticus]|uniref:hypothetical protein n=1 Tax=Halomicrococcus gelatinilyticus TaxID=1702103 RepID=UPI002E105F9A
MQPRGNRGPGRRRLVRLLLLLVVLSTGGRFLRGGGLGGTQVVPDGVGGPVVVAVVAGLAIVGGVLAFRAGAFDRRGASGTSVPDGEYTCRYCGTDLERYRNRCPHCETRDPVASDEEW